MISELPKRNVVILLGRTVVEYSDFGQKLAGHQVHCMELACATEVLAGFQSQNISYLRHELCSTA